MSEPVTSPTGSSTRSYLKCPQCRKDGKKCEVDDDRQHPYAWTKCRRCARLGHQCGPRVRAPSGGQRTLEAPKPTSGESVTFTEGFRAQEQRNVLQDEPTIPDLRYDSTPMNLIEWLTAQDVLYRLQCELLHSSRKLSNDPILGQCRLLIKTWHSKLETLYRCAMRSWQSQFDAQKHAEILSKPASFEVLQLKFEIGQYRHKLLDTNWHNSELVHGVTPESASDATSSLHGPEFVNCTRQIVSGIDPVTFHLLKRLELTTELAANEYSRAERQIQEIFRPLFGDEAVQTGFHRRMITPNSVCFPAEQVAYWNGDEQAVLELAIQGNKLNLRDNVFGENLIHLIAKAGDYDMFDKLKKLDRDGATEAAICRGTYSALSYATIMDDTRMFNSMIENCVNPLMWTGPLLSFAILARSQHVLAILLSRKDLVMPSSYTDAMAQAIHIGAENIAQQVLPFLANSGTTEAQLKHLISQAESMFMVAVASSLRSLQLRCATIEEALADLGGLKDRLTNENTRFIPYLSSNDNSQTSPSTSTYGYNNYQLSPYNDANYAHELCDGGAPYLFDPNRGTNMMLANRVTGTDLL